MKKIITLIIFFVMFSQITYGYYSIFRDDYTPYSSSTLDDKSWIDPYTLEYEFKCNIGDGQPDVIIVQRDSGQELGTFCRNAEASALCQSTWFNLDNSTCDGNENYGNLCDAKSDNGMEVTYPKSDRLTMIFYEDTGASCDRYDTAYDRWYRINQTYYQCNGDRSGLQVYGDSWEWSGSGAPSGNPNYAVFIGTVQGCPTGTACNVSGENITQALQTEKNFTLDNNICVSCDADASEFVNYCYDNKHYRTYKRYTITSCGNTEWFENSSINTCPDTNFCDMSSFDVVTNVSAVTNPCFGGSDTTSVDFVEEWGSNFNVESTLTDNIVFNWTRINFTIDGITFAFPEEVACYTTAKDSQFYTTMIINGEEISVFLGNNYTLNGGIGNVSIVVTGFDIDEQKTIFRINNNGTICNNNQLSMLDENDININSFPTVTFDCDGDSFETTLYYADFYYLNYDCYGGSDYMNTCIASSYNASQRYAYDNSKEDLYWLNENEPTNIHTSVNAWEQYFINLTGEQRNYNLTMKYYTRCNINDAIANSSQVPLVNNYSGIHSIWN